MSEEQRDGDSCKGTLDSADHHDETSPANINTTLLANTGSATNSNNGNKDNSDNHKANLRRGKWTPEEEAFARAVICDFNSGYLDAPIGTTLRAFLSGKLECDPMRVTKKFTKDDSLGKKVFRPAAQYDAKVAKEAKDAQVGNIA